MNFASGLPVSAIVSAFTWYGVRSSIRSAQTSSASPIDTQTSVRSTSQPFDRLGDVLGDRDLAPLSAALVRELDELVAGQSDLGLAMRTSMPSFAPPTR